jgi:hypothetical protein
MTFLDKYIHYKKIINNMRYLKTFEGFSEPINEELLGDFGKKIKDAFTGWKDSMQKKAADYLSKAIEENKNKPEMKEALAKLAKEAAKLSEEDKKKIAEVAAKGEVPSIPETKEDMSLKSELKGGEVSESLLLEKESSLVASILKWFGLTVGSASFVGLIITVIKIAIAGSGYPTWLFGLSLGTIGSILIISTFVSGLISGIGNIMETEE